MFALRFCCVSIMRSRVSFLKPGTRETEERKEDTDISSSIEPVNQSEITIISVLFLLQS